MSHIAIDARIINSSTGRYVERLLHYLQTVDQVNQYSVLVPAKDRDYFQPTNPNFTIITADFAQYSLAEQLGLKRLLDQLQPDLVHFCMPQQPVLYRGRKVTTVHDLTLLKTRNSDKNWLVFTIKQFVGQFVFKHIARNSDRIIVPSEFTRDELVDFSPSSKNRITLTYESADIPVVLPLPYTPLIDKKYLLYVGGQSDYKNIRRLIEAHQLLLPNHPDLLLALVGKLTGRNGVAAARNKAWSEAQHHRNVIFTDFVPDAQLSWLYQQSQAYVFPSLMEGFGLPGLEAMLHGTPVIASSATCLPEIYGQASVYFDPTDSRAMAAAIASIVDDTIMRAELIKKGYQQAAHYSWQRMAEQTHAVYLAILEDSTNSHAR